MRKVLAGTAILLLASPALADGAKSEKAPPVERMPPPPVAPHQEGSYGGVAPGQKPDPAAQKPGKAKRPPPKGTLSWIGFEAKDGGAQVFFQSIAPFEVTQQVVGSMLYVYLSLPRMGANTWRQVDTRFFDNPLSGIVAHPTRASKGTKDRPAHPGGIEVRIAFKNPKDAKEAALRTATEADGRYYVYLTFPEGTETQPQPTTMKDPEK